MARSGELSGDHGGEAVEHPLEPQIEAVLEAFGVVRGASVDDDAGQERIPTTLNQTLDVGDLAPHPLLLVKTGASDGLLLGELLEDAPPNEGVERLDHHEHVVDLEAETVDESQHLLVELRRIRPEIAESGARYGHPGVAQDHRP
jgi:hypothetical protein